MKRSLRSVSQEAKQRPNGLMWIWLNHRAWVFSGLASVAILGGAFLLIRSLGISAAHAADSFWKVLGGIIGVIVILPLGIYLLRRFWGRKLLNIGLIVGFLVGAVLLYVNFGRQISIWWPISILGLIVVFAIVKLLPRRPSTTSPGTTTKSTLAPFFQMLEGFAWLGLAVTTIGFALQVCTLEHPRPLVPLISMAVLMVLAIIRSVFFPASNSRPEDFRATWRLSLVVALVLVAGWWIESNMTGRFPPGLTFTQWIIGHY